MRAWRQISMYVLASVLAACGAADAPDRGAEGFVTGFFGGVAADEPRAALEGRRVLSSGGSAADAATAIYFTLAVTLPSAASLGGGGVCLVFDPKKNVVEALEFLARAPQTIPATASRPSAIPGNPLGMFALHSRHGRLPWPSVVANGEKLARLGTETSRALAIDMAPVAAALIEDSEAKRIFSRGAGRAIREGEFLQQIDLGSILSIIRTRGPGELYRGTLARSFVDAVKSTGGSVTIEDLRRYRPTWRPTVTTEISSLLETVTIHYAPPPAAAGIVAGQIFEILRQNGNFRGDPSPARAHLVAEASLLAFTERWGWMKPDFMSTVPANSLIAPQRIRQLVALYNGQRHLPSRRLDPPPVVRPENPSATSFVVIDRDGGAVACTHSMNSLFGTSRVARGTGIVLAAVPGAQGRGPVSLGPMMAVNHRTTQFIFAGAASGGAPAPSALASVAARNLLAEEDLEPALRAPRVHHGGAPDVTFYEPAMPRTILNGLAARGHRLGETPVLGRVNAAFCPGGLPRLAETCSVQADPRGHGLALNAEE